MNLLQVLNEIHRTLGQLRHEIGKIQGELAARARIDNAPPPDVMGNLVRLAQGLELVRAALGNNAVHITSGYRSPRLNQRSAARSIPCTCKAWRPTSSARHSVRRWKSAAQSPGRASRPIKSSTSSDIGVMCHFRRREELRDTNC